jgi:Cupin-like domain
MFIASPNSVTPFHIDKYSTLLMQFKGSKTITVFPPLDKRVVTIDQCEDYVAHCTLRGPQWNPEAERYGTTFDFAPGEAIHIPCVARHHVRNGPQDVSISLPIIFKSAQTERMRKAMSFNRKMRPLLSPFGIVPALAGKSVVKDTVKAALFTGAHRISRAPRSR